MCNDMFVFCEQRDGQIQAVSLELLGVARELAAANGGKVCALLLGYQVYEQAPILIAHGADIVYVVDHPALDRYLTEPYAQAVTQITLEHLPNAMLFGATSIGRDLAPRLSARLHTGLTADCTKLEMDADGNLFMTRPAFGGNLFATIVCPGSRPQMSTVRPGVMQKLAADFTREGQIVSVDIHIDECKFAVELLEEVPETQSVDRIEDATILVSCGRGVKNTDAAFELAGKIGGTVSASRALVDAGVLEQPRQVGQTGKTVRPAAYLAFGISGAIQHLAGMEDSEFIVAVNTDASAPIFKVANLGIVADAAATMAELNKLLEKV